MIRTPEDLLSFYEAELSEKDAILACDELVVLTQQPGWRRVMDWLSRSRDNAFQDLRGTNGTAQQIAERFWRWQQVDLVYEGLANFIRLSVEHGEDVRRRTADSLHATFLREEIYGRTNIGASTGSAPTGDGPAPTGPVTDSY